MKKITSLILSFMLLLTIIPTMVYGGEEELETQPPLTSTWAYFDENLDPAKPDNRTSWTQWDFRTGATPKQGTSPFGAKRGKPHSINKFVSKTTLNQYIDGNGKNIPTYFFLQNFKGNTDPTLSLSFDIQYDDAAIVYINGQKVWEGNVAPEGYSENMAYGAARAGSEPNEENVTLSPAILQGLIKADNTVAVELHQERASSSDIYFNIENFEFKAVAEEPEISEPLPYTTKFPVLTIGKNSMERNFTWYASNNDKGYLEYALANPSNDFKDGKTIEATAKIKTNVEGFASFQCSLEDLQPNKEYMLRYWNGESPKSEVYKFKTQGKGDYSFFLVGDPQIGAGSRPEDIKGWEDTLGKMRTKNENASFILSAGDQVNKSYSEEEYEGFIERENLKGFAMMPVIGNHDAGNVAFSEHFALPNVLNKGASTAGSNYYYVHNNTLFIALNSNNRSIAEHKATIEEALDATKDMGIKWKVVTFHHSIYSVASHAVDSDILQRRQEFAPLLQEFKIDVVLMGHDHVYARTHLMEGLNPIVKVDENGEIPSEYVDPEGTLYLTVNSASGSKYYKLMQEEYNYTAVKNQERVPNYTEIKVTDNSFEAITYRTTDDTVVDTVKLTRKPEIKKFTVNFETDGGKPVPGPLTLEEGKQITEPNPPVKDGYVFKGWFNGEKKFNFQTPIDENITLVAHWEADSVIEPLVEYDVTVEGGKADLAKAKKGDKVTITANKAPEGKEFDKWALAEDLAQVELKDPKAMTTEFTMVEGAVKLVATYKDLPPVPNKPEIIKGADSQWKKGDIKGLEFVSDAEFEDLIKVQVDDEDLDKGNYELKRGSIKVTLKAKYLDSLKEGRHTLAIISKGGAAVTSFEILPKDEKDTASENTGKVENKSVNKDNVKTSMVNSPKTGDTASKPWLLLSLAIIGLLIISYKKREKLK